MIGCLLRINRFTLKAVITNIMNMERRTASVESRGLREAGVADRKQTEDLFFFLFFPNQAAAPTGRTRKAEGSNRGSLSGRS